MPTKRSTEAAAESTTSSSSSSSCSKRVHTSPPLDELCINSVRCLAAELPQQAKSGHPGAPMGCAPMAHVLFGKVMNFSPEDPSWPNRDRFVLSNGHCCALLYVMLHLSGYKLTMDDLKRFRQLGSSTPGHPESFATPGVEVCTGPLGQGISNAVGMALAATHFAKKYNRTEDEDIGNLFDSYVFCICGDGCLQEGVSCEASSLAGHLGLGRLIALYDDNHITIDGATDLSFTEDVGARYQAYGWHVQEVPDGDHDWQGILKCVELAKAVTDKPSLIKITTTIGFGSAKQGSEKTHGTPIGEEDLAQVKLKFGLDPKKSFEVESSVSEFYRKRGAAGEGKRKEWAEKLKKYSEKYPVEGAQIKQRFQLELPEGFGSTLPSFSPDSTPEATRSLSGKCLNAIAEVLPEVIGGSADLTGSNSSGLQNAVELQKGSEEGRYIRFGVREHGMAAIANGLFSFGGCRPFAATFLNFITYAWGAVRLSALSQFGILYIGTHDSVELGEDGPTHQPVETIPLLRATPNLLLFRPADGNETAAGYLTWINNPKRPTVLALCRAAVPHLVGSSREKAALRGGYILQDFGTAAAGTTAADGTTAAAGTTAAGGTAVAGGTTAADGTTAAAGGTKPPPLPPGRKVLLAGSGSELHLCVKAKELLEADNEFSVRVVSMPCWEILAEQTAEYQQEVLLQQQRKSGDVLTAYVEAASSFGWEKYFDILIGLSSFGISAPKKDTMHHFGFTAENITLRVREHAQQIPQPSVNGITH
eukprot:GHVS01031245.1.p1 GENE.GHVS01031245.1~~GHVS01031245.1.p1  ORF type:complete len:761 (-),score=173.02 GHVS01031245.1:399-2681(-)